SSALSRAARSARSPASPRSQARIRSMESVSFIARRSPALVPGPGQDGVELLHGRERVAELGLQELEVLRLALVAHRVVPLRARELPAGEELLERGGEPVAAGGEAHGAVPPTSNASWAASAGVSASPGAASSCFGSMEGAVRRTYFSSASTMRSRRRSA